jgi:hypothetical protein
VLVGSDGEVSNWRGVGAGCPGQDVPLN